MNLFYSSAKCSLSQCCTASNFRPYRSTSARCVATATVCAFVGYNREPYKKRINRSRCCLDYGLGRQGPRSPQGKGRFCGYLPAHCEVQGISGVSRVVWYVNCGRSDATFRYQSCSNLFLKPTNLLIAEYVLTY